MTTTAAAGTAAAANPYAAIGLDQIGATEKDAQTASADRFLKMLIAQMQNQDPLNPMDNAQVTSQMAQINTVSGLEKVNGSVQSLASQLLGMQALQGASLVGREVAVDGNALLVDAGTGRGGFTLSSPATTVAVTVKDAAGQQVGSFKLESLDAGQHSFEWDASKQKSTAGLTFEVSAVSGKNAVAAKTLTLDRVQAVSTGGDALLLQLRHAGTVAADRIASFN